MTDDFFAPVNEHLPDELAAAGNARGWRCLAPFLESF
jgi:hypothetical protein